MLPRTVGLKSRADAAACSALNHITHVPHPSAHPSSTVGERILPDRRRSACSVLVHRVRSHHLHRSDWTLHQVRASTGRFESPLAFGVNGVGSLILHPSTSMPPLDPLSPTPQPQPQPQPDQLPGAPHPAHHLVPRSLPPRPLQPGQRLPAHQPGRHRLGQLCDRAVRHPSGGGAFALLWGCGWTRDVEAERLSG